MPNLLFSQLKTKIVSCLSDEDTAKDCLSSAMYRTAVFVLNISNLLIIVQTNYVRNYSVGADFLLNLNRLRIFELILVKSK